MHECKPLDNGITLIVEKTQTFVTFWEKTYEHVWKQAGAYIRSLLSST